MPLPPPVASALDGFVQSARECFGPDLVAVVLFGSAAEDRLRATSDVNVAVVLSRFDPARAATFAEAAATARVACRLSPMFLLAAELPQCAAYFATKFGDIVRRHRVLFGADVFRGLVLERRDQLRELRQFLLNSSLRLRTRYVEVATTEERSARVIADVAGPIRVAARTLLELEGRPAESPREALVTFARTELGSAGDDLAARISAARAAGALPPGVGPATLKELIGLVDALRARAEVLA